ncbi:MAG: molybdopterin-dependent oxidoreductase [Lachnospiraceae bacterium]
MKKVLSIVLSMMLVCTMFACAAETTEEAATIPAFEVTVVTADGEVTITEATIADLEVVNKDVVKSSKSGETTNNWTGVNLMDALAEVGVESFTTLSVEASDGYAADYDLEMAEATLIAYLMDGEELGEDGPVNTVIDGGSASAWMKNFTKVTVVE